MSAAQENPDIRRNRDALREEALSSISLFAGLTGFAWLTWVTFGLGASFPIGGWAGLGLLILGALGGLKHSQHRLHLATHLLAWGILGSVACLMYTFPSPAIACLAVVPVICASVLLGDREHILMAAVAGLLVLILGLTAGVPSPAADWVLLVIAIAVATVASRVSARSLYTAQAWAWSGYERAHNNEQIVRQRQAELGRALKALDEATYRLERANYMLLVARDQAEEARRLKQQFAQTISHELRTPLNLVVGFAELMSKSSEYYGSQLPAPYLRDLRILHRNASHLQDMVNDVLDLSRIEAAQMGLLPEEIEPAALVLEAVNTARSLVEARGLALQTQIDPDLPRLWADPVRIRQVLYNLLNNAARFTERGSVTVSARRRGEEVIFAVVDTGVGITVEDMPRIFEEFQQVDGGTRRRHEGVGLGLAISRRFVELHGGRIWVESEVGRGSTFHFSLPVGPREPLAAAPGAHSEEPSAPLALLGEEPILLAVTRSPSAAALLTRYVRGGRTVVAHDLQQARQAAQQLVPQAVVIDQACDDLDPTRLEGLAEAWGLAHTPVIVCPLPGEEPLRQRLAVDGYLVKPVSRSSLWDVLRRFSEDVNRVLVVDDDRDFVLLMDRMLDSPLRRYEVVSAYSGQEGLEMMRLLTPDLVLLDMGLPDMDGSQVIDHIRSNPGWQGIPIVVISGQDAVDGQEALKGAMSIARSGGLTTGEVVEWVQKVLETATRRSRSAEGGRGGGRRA